MLQTVTRAGRVLDLFSCAEPEWGATAVAGELGIAKSQAHELLVSLADIGLLQRARPGRYRLGWRVACLNTLFLDTSDLGREAGPVMRTLASRCEETVQLAVWGSGSAVCIAAFDGGHSTAAFTWPTGGELPGHCTAAGKVLLASRQRETMAHELAGAGLERRTERTIVSGERLRAELASVRRRGVAFEDEERARDVCGVAAPILDARGGVLAALGMVVGVARWQGRAHEYTRVLLAAASRVSRLVQASDRQDAGGSPQLRPAAAPTAPSPARSQ